MLYLTLFLLTFFIFAVPVTIDIARRGTVKGSILDSIGSSFFGSRTDEEERGTERGVEEAAIAQPAVGALLLLISELVVAGLVWIVLRVLIWFVNLIFGG